MAASAQCTRTFTSTREPSRFNTEIRRSTVKRPRSALRMREKSAAAIPVRECAARTVSRSRSSALMISAARMALNCCASALLCPKSRNAFPLPRTTSNFSLFIAAFPSYLSRLDVVISDNDCQRRAPNPGFLCSDGSFLRLNRTARPAPHPPSPQGVICLSRGRQPAVTVPLKSQSPPRRAALLPQHLSAIEPHPRPLQQHYEFLFKPALAMVFLLIRDVPLHRVNLRRTHADACVPILPRKPHS